VGTALELSCGSSQFKPRAIYQLTWLGDATALVSLDIDQEQRDCPWPCPGEGNPYDAIVSAVQRNPDATTHAVSGEFGRGSYRAELPFGQRRTRPRSRRT
jgi:hypothetical protein